MPDQTTSDKSLPTLAAELWELVRAYVMQETLEPVKGIRRFVVWGVAGSFTIAIGLLLLALALLRFLQAGTNGTFETTWALGPIEGNWTFVPYVITLVACAAVVGLAASRMRKRGSRA